MLISVEEAAKAIGIAIGAAAGSGVAAWTIVTGYYRRAYRRKVQEREESSDGSSSSSNHSADDTGEFLVRVMEPEIKRQHQQYGRRLADLGDRFDEHMEEAVPAMRMVTELKTRVEALERSRQEDKREIIDAIDKHENRMSDRLVSIEAYLRADKIS